MKPNDDESKPIFLRTFALRLSSDPNRSRRSTGEEVATVFHQDGFVVLSQAIPNDLLKEWQDFGEEYFRQCFEILHQVGHIEMPIHQILSKDIGSKRYTLGLGAKHGFREIVMRSPGRYELSLLNLDATDFEKVTNRRIHIPDTSRILSTLEPLFVKLLGKTESIKLCHLSLLVATPGSTDQGWHADGGHVSIDDHLPCHCFNAFLPLHDVPLEMGPTEFRPGGHFLTRNLAPMMLAAKCRKTLRAPVWPSLTLGDVVLFDYRALHRGRANTTHRNRIVLVFTFCEPWFEDVLNFPKRSMMDPPCGKE